VHLKPPVARSARKKLKIISGQTTGADTLRHNHPPYSLLRMSGGKTCDKQADQYIAKETGETSVVTSRNTVAVEDEVHVVLRLGPGPTLVSLLRFYYSEKLGQMTKVVYERYIRLQKMCILRISEFGFLEF
jgi:hypothetical protein